MIPLEVNSQHCSCLPDALTDCKDSQTVLVMIFIITSGKSFPHQLANFRTCETFSVNLAPWLILLSAVWIANRNTDSAVPVSFTSVKWETR